MGFKLPDHSAAGPAEKRWFNGLLAFSLAAAVIFFGRVLFVVWGKGELAKQVASVGTDESKLAAATAFLQQLQFGEMIGWALLMICCTGFIICMGMWFRTMKIRLKSGGRA